MHKLFLYILLSLQVYGAHAKRYTEVPALIYLNRSEQEDTNGFNLVEHLPPLVYKAVLDGKLTLWDSPKKQIAISPEALKQIENSNSVSFAKTNNLFINELWTGSRRKTEFVIIGFSFLTESPKGKISFGFVDIAEAYGLLSGNNIPCNVNGPAQLSYLEALYSRAYQFNLLQFGNRDFSSNPAASFAIKKDAFQSRKKVQGLYRLPQTKMITYVPEKNPSEPSDPGTELYKNLEAFLNGNKEILFNIGGDKYFDYQNRLFDVSITRIEITEIWEKSGNSIRYVPYSIRIFANNRPLNTLRFDEVAAWQLLINFKTLEDLLQEKKFDFSIYKLNKDLIHFSEAPLYLKALREYKWTQVSNYVKYSKD